MKLFILYDDAAIASKEDLALKTLTMELKKSPLCTFIGTMDVEPANPDFETVKKAITFQKEFLDNGPSSKK